jgi:hypothetical protein
VRLAGAVSPFDTQLHPSVIAVDDPGEQQPLVQQLIQGIEQRCRTSQPVSQRGPGDGDPGAGQLPGQAMHRRVISELGGDDVGQQPRPAQALGDGADLGRPRRLQALLRRHRRRVAMPAGVTLPDSTEHEKACRLQVQLLGGLFADANTRLATAGTEPLRLGQVVDDLAPLEVLGQGGAAVRVVRAWRPLGVRVASGLAFGAPAEALLHGRVELAAQLGVLVAQARHLGEQLPDHLLQRLDVVGQRGVSGQGGGIHAGFNPATAAGQRDFLLRREKSV